MKRYNYTGHSIQIFLSKDDNLINIKMLDVLSYGVKIEDESESVTSSETAVSISDCINEILFFVEERVLREPTIINPLPTDTAIAVDLYSGTLIVIKGGNEVFKDDYVEFMTDLDRALFDVADKFYFKHYSAHPEIGVSEIKPKLLFIDNDTE